MVNFKNLLFLLPVFFVFEMVGQIHFVPAYYIDNDENKVECLIKDRGWGSNPDSIYYKLNDSSEVFTFGVQAVSAFQVSSSKYVRCKTLIDQSSSVLDEMSQTRNPEFEEKTVFLKVLLEGEKSLLYYNRDALSRFFIESEGVVAPLISKVYSNETGVLRHNDRYIGQLTAYLGVDENICREIQNCDYYEESLIGVFELYHQIICDECVTYKDATDHFIYLSPLLGLEGALLHSELGYSYGDLDMLVMSACLGFELEYVLPFNNGIWSAFTNPTIQICMNSSTEFNDVLGGKVEARFDCVYVKIPFGIRYNLYVSEDIDVGFDVSGYYPLDLNISLTINTHVFEPQTVGYIESGGPSFVVGCGVRYKDFMARASFNGVRDIAIGRSSSSSSYLSYSSASLSLAYRFQISK